MIVREPTDEEITCFGTYPIWECGVSTFDWHYDREEECLVISGEVIVKHNNGQSHIKSGDFVVFPKGMSCVWEVKSPVKKHYKFN